jgi:ABC-type multidrug transport system ATPase subunit
VAAGDPAGAPGQLGELRAPPAGSTTSPKGVARSRADELLEQFGLVDAAERVVKTYSGGMRRRLDLAASLILAPPVLFLDELTTGLDPRSRIEVWDGVRALVAGGTTVLLTRSTWTRPTSSPTRSWSSTPAR